MSSNYENPYKLALESLDEHNSDHHHNEETKKSSDDSSSAKRKSKGKNTKRKDKTDIINKEKPVSNKNESDKLEKDGNIVVDNNIKIVF